MQRRWAPQTPRATGTLRQGQRVIWKGDPTVRCLAERGQPAPTVEGDVQGALAVGSPLQRPWKNLHRFKGECLRIPSGA